MDLMRRSASAWPDASPAIFGTAVFLGALAGLVGATGHGFIVALALAVGLLAVAIGRYALPLVLAVVLVAAMNGIVGIDLSHVAVAGAFKASDLCAVALLAIALG